VFALWIAVAIIAATGLTVLCSGLVAAWRRERRRSRLLAERLVVEGRIEQLTAQTLQAMRQSTRDHLRGQR
jgi:hypothetical protein